MKVNEMAMMNEIKCNTKFISHTFILSALIALPQLITPTSFYHLKLLIVFAVLLALSVFIHRLFFAAIAIPLLINNVLVSHIYLNWGSREGVSSRTEVSILSPPDEKSEYLASYVGVNDYLMLGYIIVVGYFSFRYLLREKKHFAYLRIFAVVGFVLPMPWIFADKNHYIEQDPIAFLYSYINAYSVKNIVDIRNENLQQRILTIPNKSTHPLPYDKIIVVMGESATSLHMGLYGYTKETTPNFSRLLSQHEIHKLDAIAPTNQTRYSLSIMLTNAKTDDFNSFASSQSIMSDFKEQGFETYWLSNQPVTGVFSSYITSIANEAEYTLFTNPNSNEINPDLSTKLDIDLINMLDKILIDDSKQMFFFHLRGSHARYSERYPEAYAVHPNSTSIVEQYDNSIYYTDHIVNKVIESFKTQAAVTRRKIDD